MRYYCTAFRVPPATGRRMPTERPMPRWRDDADRTGQKSGNTQPFPDFAFIVFLAIAGDVFDLSSKPQKYGTPKKTHRR